MVAFTPRRRRPSFSCPWEDFASARKRSSASRKMRSTRPVEVVPDSVAAAGPPWGAVAPGLRRLQATAASTRTRRTRRPARRLRVAWGVMRASSNHCTVRPSMTLPSPAPSPRPRPPFPLSPSFLTIAATALILAPAIALLPGLTAPTAAPPFYPHGHHAVLELYTRLAASGDQRLGPYSRFHFHHPGPALFYLSMPIYELSGESHEGLKLAALPLNPLSFAGLLPVARRLGCLAPAL